MTTKSQPQSIFWYVFNLTFLIINVAATTVNVMNGNVGGAVFHAVLATVFVGLLLLDILVSEGWV